MGCVDFTPLSFFFSGLFILFTTFTAHMGFILLEKINKKYFQSLTLLGLYLLIFFIFDNIPLLIFLIPPKFNHLIPVPSIVAIIVLNEFFKGKKLTKYMLIPYAIGVLVTAYSFIMPTSC